MEDAGSKGSICMSEGKDVAEVLHLASTAAGDDGDGEFRCKAVEGFAGKALFHAIVVHAGEEYLAGSPVVHFLCPLEEVAFRRDGVPR